VAHVAFADPVCSEVAAAIGQSCEDIGVVGTKGGTYVCIEGPQFSTKAESNLYRSWNADVIGMTNLQEAKLSREAEICYATMAMVTDYDCWHPDHDSVTVEQIVKVLNMNAENAARVVKQAVALMPRQRQCKCGSALEFAIITDPAKIPAATRQKLALFLDKYLTKGQEAKA
jgi:5'-methylthioadenosine phosphorylase